MSLYRSSTRVLSSLHHHHHTASSGSHKCIEYCRGWAWQQILLTQRLQQRKQIPQKASSTSTLVDADDIDIDSILLLEHAPVYTLGRGASEEHLLFLNNDNNSNVPIREKLSRKYRGKDSARLVLNNRRDLEELLLQQHPTIMEEAVSMLASSATPVLAPNDVPIYRVDRGGEVTFHGPSQLVVYPLFDLKQNPFQADLHWFLRQVEEVVIRTLQHYGLEGQRDEINSGVWVGENKIAAIGVSASSWISSHGFSLNVSPELEYFDTSMILPCGIEGRGVTSIQQEIDGKQECPSLDTVAAVVLQEMQEVFQIEVDEDPSLFTTIS